MTTFMEALHLLAEHESKRPECPMGTAEQDAAWAEAFAAWEAEHNRLLAITGSSLATPPQPKAAHEDAPAIGEAAPLAGELATSKEASMPRIAKGTDPEEHLDRLLIRLAGHQSRRAHKSAYSTKIAIREWCAEHGLTVPPEAQPRVGSEQKDLPAPPVRAHRIKALKPPMQVPPPQGLDKAVEVRMSVPEVDIPQVLKEIQARAAGLRVSQDLDAQDRLHRLGDALQAVDTLLALAGSAPEGGLASAGLVELGQLLGILGEFAHQPLSKEGAA